MPMCKMGGLDQMIFKESCGSCEMLTHLANVYLNQQPSIMFGLGDQNACLYRAVPNQGLL